MIWQRIFRVIFGTPLKIHGCPVGDGATPFWDYYDDDWECA